MSASIEEKIRAIICEQLAVEQEKVVPEAAFMEDLGADSLDIIELVMTMEEEFDISIEDEESKKMRTVGDVVQYITNHSQNAN